VGSGCLKVKVHSSVFRVKGVYGAEFWALRV
jgi:hypothetical protein